MGILDTGSRTWSAGSLALSGILVSWATRSLLIKLS